MSTYYNRSSQRGGSQSYGYTSGRGRGRGGYASSSSWSGNEAPTPDPVPLDLGEILETISKDDLGPTKAASTTIRNAEGVASFNWIGDVDEPTIAIPGAPPRWTPPQDHPQLREDSGIYFRDMNAAYSPQKPLHATALAILENKGIPTAAIDLVACASTLRSLFLFASGERKTFRIMVKTEGKTVFLIRREGSPREAIPNVRGYGHSMPEAYTTWHADVKGSVSNQRIVRYKFAGMDCLVRYEPDGYLPDKLPTKLPTKPSAPLPRVSADPALSVDAELDAAMRGANFSSRLPDRMPNNNLKVKSAGIHIPQCATFELKTRSSKRKDEDFLSEFSIRLWVTQTPYFVLAFHKAGRFNEIRIRDVRSEILAWEGEYQDKIKKFAALLELLVKRARAEPDGKLELWRHERGDMELLMPDKNFDGALPLSVEARWTGTKSRGTVV